MRNIILTLLVALALPAGVLAEKSAFLGVVVNPASDTLKSQLKVDHGVVVKTVAEESSVDGVLKKHDLLTKIDDQLIFNPEQLSSLVHTRKKGQDVEVEFIRGGKKSTAKVTLGEREVAEVTSPLDNLLDPRLIRRLGLEDLKLDLDGLNGENLQDIVKNAISSSSTSSTVWVDGDAVSFQLNGVNGSRNLKIVDDGEIVFDGPYNTEEEKNAVPEPYKERVKNIEKKVRVDAESGEKAKKED